MRNLNLVPRHLRTRGPLRLSGGKDGSKSRIAPIYKVRYSNVGIVTQVHPQRVSFVQ